ncbi:MAG: sulfatase-like hydrolase/transferase [Acidobacteriota bacterium]
MSRGRTQGAIAVAVALLAGCGARPAPAPTSVVTARHLVLVTIDTLRADRLGAYGASLPTPNFDRLAREGVRALDASTHVPITRPAHTSLLTGLYPAEHGIRDNISLPLAANVPTLAEVLAARGFTTAAFVSSFVLGKQSGLDRGFSYYDDAFDAGGDPDATLFVNSVQRRGDATLARLEAWLDGRSAEATEARTALWVHLYDPHDPYEPPEPYATTYADRPYDGEVAWTDSLLGRLRGLLEARHLWNDAVVVVMADHGEALGEHGETGHGFFAYETTLKIPFVIRAPGLPAGTTVAGTVRTIDVMPTVLELLGVSGGGSGSALPHMTGTSLVANLAAGGPAIAHATYAESLTPLVHYQWSDLRVRREGSWKYILAPRPELYDLATDPGEARDLSATQPARARALRAALETTLREERDRAVAAGGPSPAAALSADTLQKLGALGYVSPGAVAGSTAQGADPKDKIGEFTTLNALMRDGLTLLHDRDYAASATKLTALRDAGAGSFQVHFYLGRALAELGRGREAEASFERAIALMPSFGQAHLALADVRLARKDPRGALAAVQAGSAVLPRDAALVDRAGQIWQQLGDRAQALAAYRQVMTLAPGDALVRWRAGGLLLEQGQADEALRLYREATVLDPTVGDYWNSIGMVLGGSGQHGAAASAFREAATRDPKNARFAYNLGLVLQRAGSAEAREWFTRTLALDPGFRPARQRLAELPR